MRVEPHPAAPAPAPRWLGVVWVWLPALSALALFGAVGALQVTGTPGVSWWTIAGVACAAAYALRDRWPVATLAVCLLIVLAARLSGTSVLTSGFGVGYLLVVFVPVLPLVAVAAVVTPRRSSLALLATIGVTVAASPDPAWSTVAYSTQGVLVDYVLNVGVPTMIALAAWLAGCALLTRQRYGDALLERAEFLELTRDAEAVRAVTEERARIARDLHDVITHTVAVMVVQASAADAIWDRDLAQARASLRAVEESGRTVMADLRGMLGAMRADDGEVEHGAQPGIEHLPALIEQIRTTGMSAQLTVAGSAEHVATATSLSLYRIAQESVTNALRHADGSAIAIDLVVDADTVRLSVVDDGIGYDAARSTQDSLDPHGEGGQGFAGMQERSTTMGGSLRIAAHPGGGTAVTVRVPIRPDLPL